MSQLVERSIFVHRRDILDTLTALALAGGDYRTLCTVAVAFGVGEEFSRRAGTVLVIDQMAGMDAELIK